MELFKTIFPYQQPTRLVGIDSMIDILEGVVRQSLTHLKVPRSHKSMKRRFGTTQ